MIKVQTEDFDPAAEQKAMCQQNKGIGAIVSFIGLMRDFNQGDQVHRLYLEHYPAMTEKALRSIVEQAKKKWAIQSVRLIHRVGELKPGDQIVLVMVASAHRGDAFRACEFIIDYLKTEAPFWKKEYTEQGERWVEARDSDQKAKLKWN